ncbi:MAG: hypothetical protein O3A51_01450, partial [Verrucomicrobia bacterium]|nr:hypothetical protein [Verrucomicrobiota bacterium]
RIRHDLGIVIVALLGMGLYSLLSLHWFNAQPDTFLASLVEGQFAWSSLLMAKCRMAVLFLFPVALLSGLLFTAVASVIRGTSTGPTHALVGSVVMWNTLGATIGALVTGFFLLPRLGMERSLLILAWAALVWSLPLAWMTSRRMRWLSVGIVILGGGLATIGTPHWDPKLMSAGAFFSPWNHVENGQVKLRQHLQAERLEYYKEGLTSTVSVTRTVDERLFFCSNGKVEADTTPRSMVLQRLIGHLPMLLHPNPQAVLNIGLGAGVTLGSLACYPVEQLDVVEIEPAVRGVAHIWQERNHDVMSRSDIRFIVNDGRNHLLLTQDRYDVITSDPFEPVVAGAASLFTVDHFSLARSRLNPGGVMGQFLPLYEMSSDDFRMIVRSFAKVFPRSLLFFTGHDTILVGFTDDHDLTFETIAAKFKIPAVRDSLAEIGLVRPESILDALVVDLSRDASIAGDGAVNTDRHPYIEFSTPRSALQYQPDINQRVLLEHMNAIPAELLRGLSSEQRTRAARGHEGLSLALRANLARSAGNLKANIDLLRDAVAAAPENRIIRNELAASLLASAMLMLRQNNITQAIVQFQLVLQYEPDAFWPLYHLVSLCMRQGDTEQADHYMSLALTAFPDAPLMIALRAKMRGTNRDFNGARADMERALEALPGQPELWADYATLLELAGDAASAATAREKAAQLRR